MEEESNLVLGVILVLLIVLVFIFSLIVIGKLYINKIKTHKAVLHQKAIDQQKAITQTIIETQENTLDVISNELHDDAGQQLTYINLQVEQLKVAHPKLTKTLEPVSQTIGQLSDSIRSLSHTISHQKLKQGNLIESMLGELQRINKLGIVKCKLTIEDGFSYEFSETERVILFRMFQEISNNMLKHSFATHYNISVMQNPLTFLFSDDGRGFDADTAVSTGTNGLINLKHRAMLIDFNFQIESKANKGTTITIAKVNV